MEGIKMTLRELIFDSMESLENIHIDFGKYTKELTEELYEQYYNNIVSSWYLCIKNNMPIMVVKLEED